ncbi:cupin domain-containing protein [Hymenobacter busanensis]|uniref:Cupin domain-containing protein n=1 Tax=Hymenobacter busanensis TaxID=2607656 RepID=A0A7L4ZYU4_9BACT|nr:quercetin 2,3-dioxygenase [Hymenobacter busanensis]KAA9331510.1 cupin domain-containing protein [Hymenobacter busanensis]QHJ08664.1 cupin domain-containing protein [Hymenobacter busanensis]
MKTLTPPHVLAADFAMQTTLMPARSPFLRRRTLAESWWYMGTLTTPLITGAETNGEFALLDVSLQRGVEPPVHTHLREDETVYVLDGQLTFHVGDEELHAGPGDVVHLPRGIRHTFRLETDYARTLLHISPAGFENFFRDLAEPAQALVIPALPTNPNAARIAAVAKHYGLQAS